MLWDDLIRGLPLRSYMSQLPPEIRDSIYGYVVPVGNITIDSTSEEKPVRYLRTDNSISGCAGLEHPLQDLQMLFPTFSQEIVEHLYFTLNFSIPNVLKLKRFLGTDIFGTGANPARYIRRLCVSVKLPPEGVDICNKAMENLNGLGTLKQLHAFINISISASSRYDLTETAMKNMVRRLKEGFWDSKIAKGFTGLTVRLVHHRREYILPTGRSAACRQHPTALILTDVLNSSWDELDAMVHNCYHNRRITRKPKYSLVNGTWVEEIPYPEVWLDAETLE